MEPKRYLLYVSRLEPENNALGVIEAYNALASNDPTIMPLVIVGDAPYAFEYKEHLKATACDKVIFTGFQFGESYEELQGHCYLYIQATEVGGTQPALIESMSYGNCVIANGTPENLEVVGDTARSFAKNNFQQLSGILAELLIDTEQVERLGALAKQRALSQFSWDAVVSMYEELLSGLLRRG